MSTTTTTAKFFKDTALYKTSHSASVPSGIAVVTGGRSGIGRALCANIASYPFIDTVLSVSRSISAADVDRDENEYASKITPLAADVSTETGRSKIVAAVDKLCGGDATNPNRTKQLRYLIHSAGTIDPIKSALEVTPEELRNAMLVNCEAPFFLSTALFPYLQGNIPGRILHVSSGAAHGVPPVGWSCYGISKAAFFQSSKVLQRGFGGKVLVGSFKPGVVDTPMQRSIRDAPADAMPAVSNFVQMKEKAATTAVTTKHANTPRPPLSGGLDTPANVAFFAEYLLTGTTDEEFVNEKAGSNEYDIRDKELFPLWIPPENL